MMNLRKYFLYSATLLLPFIIMLSNAQAQEVEPTKKNVGLSIGFLNGSSYVGSEIEYMVFPHIAPTVGVGLIGYNAGLNLHLRDHVNSSYLGLTYGHAGMLKDEYMEYAEISINFRFLWIVELSIGQAYTLSTGEGFIKKYRSLTESEKENHREVGEMFTTYSLGFYWTF